MSSECIDCEINLRAPVLHPCNLDAQDSFICCLSPSRLSVCYFQSAVKDMLLSGDFEQE